MVSMAGVPLVGEARGWPAPEGRPGGSNQTTSALHRKCIPMNRRSQAESPADAGDATLGRGADIPVCRKPKADKNVRPTGAGRVGRTFLSARLERQTRIRMSTPRRKEPA